MKTSIVIRPGESTTDSIHAHEASAPGANRAKKMLMGLVLAVAMVVPLRAIAAGPAAVNLLSTARYTFLAYAGITDATTLNTITGDVGASPITGTAIHLLAAQVNGTIYCVDAAGPLGSIEAPGMLTTNMYDLTTAYNDAAGRTSTPPIPFVVNPGAPYLGGNNIGGMTLVPGVYKFTSAAYIHGTDLTLDAGGDMNAVWIFQIGDLLDVDAGLNRKVILAGGAQAGNIFWQVSKAATLGTYCDFKGTIMAYAGIVIDTGATLVGRAMSLTESVTFNGSSANLPTTPKIDLQKTVSGGAGAFPGGELVSGTNGAPATYWFVVSNPGDVTLTNVIVTDLLLGYTSPTWTLTPGQSVTTSVPRTITATMLNTATALGRAPDGSAVTDTDTAQVNLNAPAIDLQKTVSGGAGAFPGGELVSGTNGAPATYWFVVSNPGDVTLTNVIVTDPLIGYTSPIWTLTPGQSVTASVPQTITATMLNTATALGRAPGGTAVTDSDTAQVQLNALTAPAIDLQKTVSGGAGAFPGGELVSGTNGAPVTYWFVVSNPGDVALTNVIVTDPLLGYTSPIWTLTPGQSVTASVPQTITATMLNTATALGRAPDGSAVTDTDTAQVNLNAPAIDLQKTVSGGAGAFPGGELASGTNGAPATYWFVASNPGDVTLTNVIVTDPLLGYTSPTLTLTPGQSVTTSVPQTITATMLNTATALGFAPDGTAVTDSDTAQVNLNAPAIDLQKTVSGGAGVFPGGELVSGTNGTPITYWFVVSNPGDVTLTNVTVTDPLIGYTSPTLTLTPGQSVTTSVPQTITANMLNTATALGFAPGGTAVTDSDTAAVNAAGPGFRVIKTLSTPTNGVALVGESLVFQITVSNTGGVMLASVPVEDQYSTNFLTFTSAVPATVNNTNDGILNWTNVVDLAPGASTNIFVTFTARRSTAGQVATNVVVVSPPNMPAQTNSATYSTRLAGYSVIKTVSNPVGGAAQVVGQPVVFKITVTNTGDVALLTLPVVDRYETAYLFFVGATPPADDTINDGTLNWTNVGPLAVGASTNIFVTFTAAGSTEGLLATNVVVVLSPNLPAQTNTATYSTINPQATPVVLKSFAAAYDGRSVLVRWETGVEVDNLGFNVYRAASVDGARTMVNSALIPGMGNSEGQSYELHDAVPTQKAYWYWLEDISWNFETKLHGPVMVAKPQGASGAGVSIGSFAAVSGGLYRISWDTMKAAKLPVKDMGLADIQIRIDGQEVAAYVHSDDNTLSNGDYILFYVPDAEEAQTCEIAIGTNALRMELVFARPSSARGDVRHEIAGPDQEVFFDASTEYVRYLLADFTQMPVWVLDITDPTLPKFLYGYSYVTVSRRTAVYMSYPGLGTNQTLCTAVGERAVMAPTIRRTLDPKPAVRAQGNRVMVR